MSYSDFIRGATAEEVRRQREIAEAAEARARAAAQEELVAILRPVPPDDLTWEELHDLRRDRE